ncbi:hypothetical protein BLNAU_14244 [Blattamonas nauphoetae]|uniref:Uncharacterized protein n=1 Tax=Blattamonas nauphoetae TaxID=2049346 RepID=A0ABQ9XEC8_9EUKA|nr:hypothetical protein BLNAU_14244 [Blattamonas nauphoetae]
MTNNCQNLSPDFERNPHKSSFQTIILDDPSFPDLILNSLKLNHNDVRVTMLMALTNVVRNNPWMKETFKTSNLVGRMFETVDFVSIPLSASNTYLELTNFLSNMLDPIGGNTEARFEQYPLIRVSVFEPAQQFITFIFHNSATLILDEKEKAEFNNSLSWIHNHITNMDLRSGEHDADIVSELVKWEVRMMVEMETEAHVKIVFQSMANRTYKWNRDKRERQKRREVLLREEGWDDAFELRVVGIEKHTNQNMLICARLFRVEQAFNSDER